jgi:hypothetical protein
MASPVLTFGIFDHGTDGHLCALLLAETGIGHVRNHIPVTGELQNIYYDENCDAVCLWTIAL